MADTNRWVQLTYSSFDRDQGAGGWQIKDLTGEPSEEESKLLQTSVVTGFDFHGETSTYPSTEEISSWPRRFSFRRTPLGGHFVHAVQAGRDSTGRPGNTYSHVVLDRSMARSVSADYLPIDLWRSDAFDTPYGVEQVLETEISSSPAAYPGPFAGMSTALNIMAMPGYREPLLAALDAVESVQHGQGMLVLVTDRQDWAALLVSAVCRLMSPGVARSLSFSLYERAAALGGLRTEGITIAVIPTADLDGIDPTVATYVLVDGELPVSDLDAHVVAHGSPIPRTDFSRMVESIIGAPDDPDLALLTAVVKGLSGIGQDAQRSSDGEADEDAGYLGLDAELALDDVNNLDIAWPLAILIKSRGRQPFAPEADAAAGDVVLRSSPISIGRSATFLPSVREVIAGSLAGSGEEQNSQVADTNRIWAALEEYSHARSTLTSALLEHAYLLAAVSDERWLDSGAAPAGRGAWRDLDDGGELRAATLDALRAAKRNCEDPDYRPDFEFKLLSFLSRVSLIGDSEGPWDEEVDHLVDSVLDSRAVRSFVASHEVPELSELFEINVRNRLLAHIDDWDPPGCSTEFLARAAQASPRNSWAHLEARAVEDLSWLDVRLMLELVRQQGAVAAQGGPPIDSGLLENAVRTAPAIHTRWSSLDIELQSILDTSQLSLETLQYVEQRYPGWLPEAGPMMFVLCVEPWSQVLEEYLKVLQHGRRESIPLVNLRVTAGSNGAMGALRTSSIVMDEVQRISHLELSPNVERELAPVVWCAALDFAANHGLNGYHRLSSPRVPDLSRFPLGDIRSVLARAEFLWSQGRAMLCSVEHLALCALIAADQKTRMAQARAVNRGSARRKSSYSLEEENWPFSEDYLQVLSRESPAGDSLVTAVLSRLAQTAAGAFLTERVGDDNKWFRTVEKEYEPIVGHHRQTRDEIDDALDSFYTRAEKWRKSTIKFKPRDPETSRRTFPFAPGRGRAVEVMKAEGER